MRCFNFLGNWGPHLIIVPTSVMLNWEMELKKWCPAFKILTYYGTQKERKHKRAGIVIFDFILRPFLSLGYSYSFHMSTPNQERKET